MTQSSIGGGTWYLPNSNPVPYHSLHLMTKTSSIVLSKALHYSPNERLLTKTINLNLPWTIHNNVTR